MRMIARGIRSRGSVSAYDKVGASNCIMHGVNHVGEKYL